MLGKSGIILIFVSLINVLYAGGVRKYNKPVMSTFLPHKVSSKSIECQNFSPTFVTITKCELVGNVASRALTIHGKLLGQPIKNAMVTVSAFKLIDNVFQPFLHNVTANVCEYLSGKKHHTFDWLYKMTEPYTNVNHSCPVNHDIIFEKIPVDEVRMPTLFSVGKYRVDVLVTGNGGLRTLQRGILDILN